MNNISNQDISKLSQEVLSKIKHLRKEKGISQTEMATFLDIKQANYSAIEAGKTDINMKKLFSIFKILGFEHFTFQNQSKIKERNIQERFNQLEAKLDLILKKLDEL